MRAIGVLAVAAAALSGVFACAGILGIEDPDFAELGDGGFVLDGGSVIEAGDAPSDTRRVSDSAPDAADERCTINGGAHCPGECLDEICSSCPVGTTNLARMGTAFAYSEFGPGQSKEKLNDGRVATNWRALTLENNAAPLRAGIALANTATIMRVSVYGVRQAAGAASDVKSIKIVLYYSDNTTVTTPLMPITGTYGDISYRVPDEYATDVDLVAVEIVQTNGGPPALSEIEICGN